jgi:pimeloyl-ACP methyl ester carboxylesterase
MVDIDGFKLFLKIKGEGKPTIIFENAMGGTSDFWDSIQATLSKITSVVTYDRAGNGKSEMSPFPRTNERMAQELHILLDKEEIDPPYILVASSYGAFISRTFSSLYPQEVAGMVLIEPVHEDLLPEMRKARTEEEWNQYIGIMDQMAENAPEGPKQEWSQYFNNSDAVRKIKLPDDISIILLTSTRFSEREKQMMYREDDIKKKYDLHKKWLNGKKNVKHLTTKKSGHNIAGREPELIIDSVIEILEKIKE